MKKIILKISFLLIASSFSLQLYPAASAAKEKTAEEVTPGGGAAPAEKKFSALIKNYNNKLKESIEEIESIKSTIQLIEEDANQVKNLPGKESLLKIYQEAIDTEKKKLEKLYKFLSKLDQQIKDQVEKERLKREKNLGT